MGAVMAPATESIMSRGAAREGRRRGRGQQLRPAGRRRARRRDPRLGARRVLRRAPRAGGRRAARRARGPRPASRSSPRSRRSGRSRPAGTRTPPAPPPTSSSRPARRSSRPCTSPPCSPPAPRSSPPSSSCVLAARAAANRECARSRTDPMVATRRLTSRSSPHTLVGVQPGLPAPREGSSRAGSRPRRPGRRDPFAPLLENPLAALLPRSTRRAGVGHPRRAHRRRPAAGHPLRRRPAPDQPGQQQLPGPGRRPAGDRGGRGGAPPVRHQHLRQPRAQRHHPAAPARSRRSSPTTTAPRRPCSPRPASTPTSRCCRPSAAPATSCWSTRTRTPACTPAPPPAGAR